MRWIEEAGLSVIAKDLRRAFERGEVLPAKPDPWIVFKPGVQGGRHCVRGTAVTVEQLRVAARVYPAVEILGMYPGLTPEGLAAALVYKLPAKGKRA